MTRKLRTRVLAHLFLFLLSNINRKQFQKILAKQGLKFKLNTKVLSADKQDGKVVIKTESAKGGNEESVSIMLLI